MIEFIFGFVVGLIVGIASVTAFGYYYNNLHKIVRVK